MSRYKRIKNKTTALCIVLIILSLLGAILSMQISGETPMNEKVRADNEICNNS